MRASEALIRVRALPAQIVPALQFLANRRRYTLIDSDTLRTRRRSETVHVFGSGSSLNEIDQHEWTRIATHDTLGFNWFVHERFVRCDFHVIRGIPDTDLEAGVWRPQVMKYAQLIRDNPCFESTVFCVQTGFRAINGNRMIGMRLLPEGRELFLWRTKTNTGAPGRSFSDGLTHGSSTLLEAVNLAFLAGWKRIVLTGVDLYDRNYFWLDAGETRSVDLRRGAAADDPHVQASTGLVELLGHWAEEFAAAGVALEVHNPRSLLAQALPLDSERGL